MSKLLSQCKGTTDADVARAYGAYDAFGKCLMLTSAKDDE